MLDLPAVQAASTIALGHLDAAAAAAKRLSDGDDDHALHDFRVAIRRLRVTVRAYPGLHEGVSRKQRRRMRKLARASNAARDAEVQVAWFRTHSKRFTPAERAGLRPLRARLRARRRREDARTRVWLQRQFGKVERKLRRRLGALRTRAGAHEAPFRGVAAAALVQHAEELTTRLRALSPRSKPVEVHATRIAAKRLRYLLEPMKPGLSEIGAPLERLKQLQDLLGELTDGHTLQRVLREGGDDAAAVAAAAKIWQQEEAGLFTALESEWPQAGPALAQQIDVLAQRLRPRITPPSLRQRAPRRQRGGAAV